MYDFSINRRPTPPRQPFWPDVDVVSRRINVDARRLSRKLDDGLASTLDDLDLGGRGHIRFDGPLQPSGHHHPAWSTTARLHGARPRPLRQTRVRIWISAWSSAAVELSLRPAGRGSASWGRRRRRRYFDLAHLAADELWRTMTAATATTADAGKSGPAALETNDRRPEAA